MIIFLGPPQRESVKNEIFIDQDGVLLKPWVSGIPQSLHPIPSLPSTGQFDVRSSMIANPMGIQARFYFQICPTDGNFRVHVVFKTSKVNSSRKMWGKGFPLWKTQFYLSNHIRVDVYHLFIDVFYFFICLLLYIFVFLVIYLCIYLFIYHIYVHIHDSCIF